MNMANPVFQWRTEQHNLHLPKKVDAPQMHGWRIPITLNSRYVEKWPNYNPKKKFKFNSAIFYSIVYLSTEKI